MKACVHIVDDDASFRTAMERHLTKAGYDVVTYAFGPAFVDRLAKRKQSRVASSWTCGYPAWTVRHCRSA